MILLVTVAYCGHKLVHCERRENYDVDGRLWNRHEGLSLQIGQIMGMLEFQ